MIDLPETSKNVCIALSGGLDSTVLVHALVKKYGSDRVKAISFDFGQRHNIELDMAEATADKLNIDHNVYQLDYLKDIAKETCALIAGSNLKPKTAEENAGDPQVNTYVPFRNLQFAAITAAYAEAKECDIIFQGLNAVDEYGYWDTSLEFTKRVNDILALNRQNLVKFVAPFVELYKDDELQLAKELSTHFGYDILEKTWSCYNGWSEDYNFKECGVCNTCTEKLTGYIQAEYTNEVIMNKFNVNEDAIESIRCKL
jgi:7-cyano-7-deazaguanine synthase